MKRTIEPVKSKYLLKMFGNELRKMDEQYYLIFKLILETGISLEEVLRLSVRSIKCNPLTYVSCHKNVKRSEYLTPDLINELKEYTGDRADDELAFHSLKDSSKALNPQNFKSALNRSSEILMKGQPPLTVFALRKTYILNIFQKEHNYKKIYALTSCRSVKGVLEYLGLPTPDPQNTYISGDAIRDKLQLEHHVKAIRKKADRVLSVAQKHCINDSTALSDESYGEIMLMLSDIDKALSRYENYVDNPVAFREMYDVR